MNDCQKRGHRVIKMICQECGHEIKAGFVTRIEEWISVKDRLPEKYTPILCFVTSNKRPDRASQYMKDGPIFVGKLGGYDCDDWCSVYGDGYIPFDDDEITHWMPLPIAPKDE